jgi:hypothetical protein
MPQIQRDPGASSSEAGRDRFAATSLSAFNPLTLRQQQLIQRHGIPAALAPLVAALAWTGGRV